MDNFVSWNRIRQYWDCTAKAARPNKSKRISGFGSSLSLLCLQLLFSYTESQTPDQGVIFIILSKSNQMSCKTLHQVRLENELEFCSHSCYGGWRAGYCVNVARKIISNTLSRVVFQLWTCTDMDSFTFESNISSFLFLPLLITYFPSYTCTFHFLCACRGPALLAGMGWDVSKTNLLSKSQNCDFTICKFKQWAAEGLMRSSDCSNQYLADQRFYVYVQPQIQKSCKKKKINKKKECMK